MSKRRKRKTHLMAKSRKKTPSNGKQQSAGENSDKKTDNNNKNEVIPTDKHPLAIIVEVIGIAVFSVLTGLFSATGHIIVSLWCGWIVSICGLVLIAHLIGNAKPAFKKQAWVISAIVALLATTGFFIWSHIVSNNVADLYRPLIPANDPMPALPDGRHPDGIERGGVVFFFGGCVAGGFIKNHPIPVVVGFENPNDIKSYFPIISVSINAAGATVSGKFFDKDGKIIAEIKDNKPIINVANSFDVQRPDSSTLIVHDQYDIEVLNIRFLRPSVFTFTGTIRSPDGAEVIVKKDEVEFTRGKMLATVKGTQIYNRAFICLGTNMSGLGLTGPGISN
jgi:hypothetical protein